MAVFDDIARLSPLPTVNLKNIAPPMDGLVILSNSSCRRNFNRSDACRKHYENLAGHNSSVFRPVQCPYGFSSVVAVTRSCRIALTGIVPYPRVGGPQERAASKRHPDVKMPIESLTRSVEVLTQANETLRTVELETIERHSMALHEIRKLNRSVKQTAERVCIQENPQDPTRANPHWVRVWKSAELMSNQFDVIELLANEDLSTLPLNSTIEIYKLFDKCARIYSQEDGKVRLQGEWAYCPETRVCDKTFPIIATVLIQNALKYSVKGSEIIVTIRPDGDDCVVKVSNLARDRQRLDNSVFLRGTRLSSDADGSGNGLFLAQLVARQHGTKISLSSSAAENGRILYTFAVRFRTITEN